MKTMVKFTGHDDEVIYARADWVVAIAPDEEMTRIWGSGHDNDFFLVKESPEECLTKLGYNNGSGQ